MLQNVTSSGVLGKRAYCEVCKILDYFFGYQFQEPSFSVGRKQPLYFDCGLF